MKTVSIHDLLSWAFLEELPKIGAPTLSVPGFTPSDLVAQMMELGTSIDRTPNRYGVISGFVHQGAPHPDAVIVGDAVRGLAERRGFEIGAGWNPFPEWADEHGVIRAEVERVAAAELGRSGRMSGRHVVHLVTSAAILRRGPDWSADEPRVVMMTRAGKPAWFVQRKARDRTGAVYHFEDDGFDQRKQRPKPGAYRKWKLAKSIRGAIIARLEWQVWQSALEVLTESLSGRLSGHEIRPFYPNMQPWFHRNIRALNSQGFENAGK